MDLCTRSWRCNEHRPTRGDPTWWRHQMETFSRYWPFMRGIHRSPVPVPGEFPTQRPVMRSFDVYFDLRPNKRLSEQWWGWWFETQSCSLWRHCNDQGQTTNVWSSLRIRRPFCLARPHHVNNGWVVGVGDKVGCVGLWVIAQDYWHWLK